MGKNVQKLLWLAAIGFFSFACTNEILKSTEKEITNFELSGLSNAKKEINQENRTISIEVPSNTNITKLKPIIRTSAYARVSPASGIEQNFSDKVIYTVTAEDGSRQEYVVVVKKLNGENRIISFKLGGLTPAVEGVIDSATSVITFNVPFGTNVEKLVPTIVTSEKAKIMPNSGTEMNFSKSISFTVTAEDGTSRYYTTLVKFGASPEKKILQFSLINFNPNVVGVVDEANKTIKCQIPKMFSTNLQNDKLQISCKVSDKATVTPKDQQWMLFSSPVQFTVTAEDGTTAAYTTTVEIAKNNNSQISNFKFEALNPAVSGTIDQTAKTISLTVPYGTDVAQLVPTITIASDAKSEPASGVAQNFSAPVSYTVTAEDGTTTTYSVSVTVAPFQTEITSVNKTTVSAGDVMTINGKFAPNATAILKGTSGDIALNVTSTPTSVAATIPSSIAVGTYTLVVESGGTSVTYGAKITVVNPNTPYISGSDKQSYVRGKDVLVLTGKNLKQPGIVPNVQIGNFYTNISVSDDGTNASLTIPMNVALGVNEVTMIWGGIFSNTITITVVENP